MDLANVLFGIPEEEEEVAVVDDDAPAPRAPRAAILPIPTFFGIDCDGEEEEEEGVGSLPRGVDEEGDDTKPGSSIVMVLRSFFGFKVCSSIADTSSASRRAAPDTTRLRAARAWPESADEEEDDDDDADEEEEEGEIGEGVTPPIPLAPPPLAESLGDESVVPVRPLLLLLLPWRW